MSTILSRRIHAGLRALVCAALASAAAVPASAQESKSAVAARALAQALDAAKLDSIAAADSANPGTFCAALYFPGSQLLVVSAKYAAPSLLTDKIAKKNYRDVYIDLSSASIPETKVFVMDSSADGLVARPDDNSGYDTVDRGPAEVAFDGDWKKAKLSEDEYMKPFSEADETYARILQLLLAQVQPGT